MSWYKQAGEREDVSQGDKLIRKACGLPFALCNDCAGLYTAAFALKKTPGADRTIVCASCHKRRIGAEYVKTRAECEEVPIGHGRTGR